MIIPRDVISKQVSLDSWILENTLKITLKVVRDYSRYLNERREIYLSAVKNETLKPIVKDDCALTFTTSFITEALYYAKERKRITENMLIIVMKYSAGCLKSIHYEDAFHSGLITLSSLILTSQLSDEYLRAIVVDTLKGLQKFSEN